MSGAASVAVRVRFDLLVFGEEVETNRSSFRKVRARALR